ncbi:hypothetical protein GCM10027059_37400 [Myceligenerans halotolerans]
MAQVGGRFRHRASRQRAREMIEALLAPVESKNCWTLAEHAGHASPDGFQYLLERARWDREGGLTVIAEGMIQAIDDATAGNYKGSWGAYGMEC